MSDIKGDGYGSKHNWKRGYTSEFKTTDYVCTDCGAGFVHLYDNIPDIFEAMKNFGVPDECKKGSGCF